MDVAFSLIVDARVQQGQTLGDALKSLDEYAARTLKRGETSAERERLRIARRNTENLKKLGALGF